MNSLLQRFASSALVSIYGAASHIKKSLSNLFGTIYKRNSCNIYSEKFHPNSKSPSIYIRNLSKKESDQKRKLTKKLGFKFHFIKEIPSKIHRKKVPQKKLQSPSIYMRSPFKMIRNNKKRTLKSSRKAGNVQFGTVFE